MGEGYTGDMDSVLVSVRRPGTCERNSVMFVGGGLKPPLPRKDLRDIGKTHQFGGPVNNNYGLRTPFNVNPFLTQLIVDLGSGPHDPLSDHQG